LVVGEWMNPRWVHRDPDAGFVRQHSYKIFLGDNKSQPKTYNNDNNKTK